MRCLITVLSLVGDFDINVTKQILFSMGIRERVVPFCFCRASFAESDSSCNLISTDVNRCVPFPCEYSGREEHDICT